MRTIDLGKEHPSLADVLTLAKSEPVVIHSGPGEDYLLEPADEFDREAARLGGREKFSSFLEARSNEAGDIPIAEVRKQRGTDTRNAQSGASMTIPPVSSVDDVTSEIIEDIRDASATYWVGYKYTHAFDELFLAPERAKMIEGFIAGKIAPICLAKSLREWLLVPWFSARTLGKEKMPALGDALGEIRATVAAIPPDLLLEHADHAMLATMVEVFGILDDCPCVGWAVACKLLAPLRPALFPPCDNPIAKSYHFPRNAAGYRKYLNITQAIARKVRGFWQSGIPLEQYLKPEGRQWTAPLAKVLDEWNWIRITQKQPYVRRKR